MILKTTRYKSTNFQKLIDYVVFDKGNASFETTILHNLHRASSTNEIAAEFKTNDVYRRKRKNGVVCYHEMLSFSPSDSKKLTVSKLERIAQEYIQLRNPNGICVAQMHMNSNCPHVHIAWHNNEYKSSKTLRMDNTEFKRVRMDLEKMQTKHFPELSASLVYLNKQEQKKNRVLEDRNTRNTNAKAFKKRTGKPLKKELLAKEISIIFDQSQTLYQFYNALEEKGYKLYKRNEKISGIITNRKYRFKTLGVDIKVLEKQQTILNKRQKELDDLMRQRDSDKEQTR